jgi:predicted RNA-binding protein with PIN domain
MLVIYSRRGEKADEVIKRMADQEREGSLIVSSDREIMHYAERVGAAVMSAEDFNFRLCAVFAGDGPEGIDADQTQWSSTKKKGPAHRDSKKLRRQRRRVKKI